MFLVPKNACQGAFRRPLKPPQDTAPINGEIELARPKKALDEQRSERLSGVRLTPAERAFIEQQAAAADLDVTEFVRRRALGQRVVAKRATADDRALVELNRVGVNLNQIAARLNASDELAHDAREVLAEVRAAVAKVAADGP